MLKASVDTEYMGIFPTANLRTAHMVMCSTPTRFYILINLSQALVSATSSLQAQGNSQDNGLSTKIKFRKQDAKLPNAAVFSRENITNLRARFEKPRNDNPKTETGNAPTNDGNFWISRSSIAKESQSPILSRPLMEYELPSPPNSIPRSRESKRQQDVHPQSPPETPTKSPVSRNGAKIDLTRIEFAFAPMKSDDIRMMLRFEGAGHSSLLYQTNPKSMAKIPSLKSPPTICFEANTTKMTSLTAAFGSEENTAKKLAFEFVPQATKKPGEVCFSRSPDVLGGFKTNTTKTTSMVGSGLSISDSRKLAVNNLIGEYHIKAQKDSQLRLLTKIPTRPTYKGENFLEPEELVGRDFVQPRSRRAVNSIKRPSESIGSIASVFFSKPKALPDFRKPSLPITKEIIRFPSIETTPALASKSKLSEDPSLLPNACQKLSVSSLTTPPNFVFGSTQVAPPQSFDLEKWSKLSLNARNSNKYLTMWGDLMADMEKEPYREIDNGKIETPEEKPEVETTRMAEFAKELRELERLWIARREIREESVNSEGISEAPKTQLKILSPLIEDPLVPKLTPELPKQEVGTAVGVFVKENTPAGETSEEENVQPHNREDVRETEPVPIVKENPPSEKASDGGIKQDRDSENVREAEFRPSVKENTPADKVLDEVIQQDHDSEDAREIAPEPNVKEDEATSPASEEGDLKLLDLPEKLIVRDFISSDAPPEPTNISETPMLTFDFMDNDKNATPSIGESTTPTATVQTEIAPEPTNSSPPVTIERYGHVLIDSTSRRYANRFSKPQHQNYQTTPIPQTEAEQAYKISFDGDPDALSKFSSENSPFRVVPTRGEQQTPLSRKPVATAPPSPGKESLARGEEEEQLQWENDRGVSRRLQRIKLKLSLQEAWHIVHGRYEKVKTRSSRLVS